VTRRTFNFTGRKTIPHNDVRIELRPDRTFEASWQFDASHFPTEACVYVEAFTSGSQLVLRFPYGTVGTPQPCSDRDLSTLPAQTVGFNLKVVDESADAGRLLGIATNVRGIGEGDTGAASQQSLLPVNPADLDQQVWRLTFEHGRPWLEVNNRISGIMEIARTDPTFFSLVYPSILRSILSRVLVQEEFTDADGDLNDWKVQWLRWGIHWHPDTERPPEGNAAEHLETWEGWIEAVVQQFCRNHAVRELLTDQYTGEQ
jgi:hypothetical protein